MAVLPAVKPQGDRQAMERFRKFVEQKIIAAPDERTRSIRLFILAAAEAALSEA